jgi:ABC-type Zn uptake system ZnuABC Zn-binding protein ZnuA
MKMFFNYLEESAAARCALAVLAVFTLALGTAACAATPSANPAPNASVSPPAPTAIHISRLKVAATTIQVAALAQTVGSDLIELHSLLKPGVDAHEYEPTPQDVRQVADAQIIFKNGVGLEKWLDRVVANSGTQAPVIDTSKGVPVRKGDAAEPQGDPHIWQSAPNLVIMLHNVRDGLVQADPPNAAAYQSNAAAYEQKLDALDRYIMQQIAAIPEANRKFVSNHDAFGYYVDRYGLTFVGSIIPSMDSSYEPSAQELTALVDTIKAAKVKAIFTESSITPALAKQIGQEAGVTVVDGALYGDSLGAPGSGAETLDGMLKANTDLIVKNLK